MRIRTKMYNAKIEERIQALISAKEVHQANIEKWNQQYNQVVESMIGEENPEKAEMNVHAYLTLEDMMITSQTWIEEIDKLIQTEKQLLK